MYRRLQDLGCVRRKLSANFAHYLWLTYDFARGDFHLDFPDGTEATVIGLPYATIKANTTPSPKEQVLTTEILPGNIAYLRIRHFEGRPKTFKKLFRDAFAKINASGASQLVLDLRGHGGGDSRVGNELARYLAEEPFRQFAYSEWKASPLFKSAFKQFYLPKATHWAIPLYKGLNPHLKAIYNAEDHTNARVEHPLIKPYGPGRAFAGQVTLLMNNHTFSAGTCFAAMFKDYGMGTIIGQESGNLANFHADGLLRLSLLEGQLNFQISNSYLVRPNGDETPRPVQPDVSLHPEVDALNFTLSTLGSEISR